MNDLKAISRRLTSLACRSWWFRRNPLKAVERIAVGRPVHAFFSRQSASPGSVFVHGQSASFSSLRLHFCPGKEYIPTCYMDLQRMVVSGEQSGRGPTRVFGHGHSRGPQAVSGCLAVRFPVLLSALLLNFQHLCYFLPPPTCCLLLHLYATAKIILSLPFSFCAKVVFSFPFS